MGVISLEQRKSSVKASWRSIKIKLEDSCRIWVMIRSSERRIHQLGVTLVEFGSTKQVSKGSIGITTQNSWIQLK